MTKTFIFVLAVIALVATGVFGYLTYQNNKSQAVQSCLETASVSTFGGDDHNNHTYKEPIMQWYQTCMKEKGYK